MKKILHIISQYPGKTGSGIFLQALIREGDKKGYIQGLIAGIPNGDSIIPKYIDYFNPVIFNTEEIPFKIVGMSDVMPYESMKYSNLTENMIFQWKHSFQRVIQKSINEFKPDIIISHHLWLSTSLVKEIAPYIKVIGICHGTDIRQLEICPQYQQEVLDGCGKLDIIFSLSKEQSNLINMKYKISKDKIQVIGGGYNGDIFYPPSKKSCNEIIKLIYAGKLSYSKGVVSLLKVLSEINDKYNIKLLLAGSGTGEEEKFIRDLGTEIGSSVEFLGELTQKELGQAFRESNIFVLPSFYEGLSLVAIEALASGLLVVASSHSSLKSYLGDDINNSGVIEYVDLPYMVQVDKPLEDNLPLFGERLKNAIEKQIERVHEDYIIDCVIQEKIEMLSWKNIFNKIEGYI